MRSILVKGNLVAGIRLSAGDSNARSSFTLKKLECSKQAYAVEYISMG